MAISGGSTTLSEAIINEGLIENVAGTNTFDGAASGAGGLTVSAGSLTVSGPVANSYTGVTAVNDGSLILAKTAGTTSVAGSLTIGDGTGATSSAIVQPNR